MAVNIANVPLARDTGSRAWISGLAALSTAVALIVLCIEVGENPMTRNHLWILAGAILASFAIARDDRLCTLQSRFESTMLFWAANKTTHRKPKG